MKTALVKLTRNHISELIYKIEVMEEGFDDAGFVGEGYIAHGYGFTEVHQLYAMSEKLASCGNKHVELDERELRAAHGELSNSVDIAIDNDHHAGVRCFKEALRRIESACEEVGVEL